MNRPERLRPLSNRSRKLRDHTLWVAMMSMTAILTYYYSIPGCIVLYLVILVVVRPLTTGALVEEGPAPGVPERKRLVWGVAQDRCKDLPGSNHHKDRCMYNFRKI